MIWLLFGPLFQIKNIVCTRDEGTCDEQISAELANLKNLSIFRFSSTALENKLTNADPSIGKIEISVDFPDTLIIEITSKLPRTAISSQRANYAYLIDKNYRIYSQVEITADLFPLILTDKINQYSISDTIDDENIINSIQLAVTLKNQFIPYSQLLIVDESAEVKLSGEITAIFSLKSDIQKQVTSLQQILSLATIDSKPTIIDLRFAKPLIK